MIPAGKKPVYQAAAQKVRGALLGRQITTKAAVPTNAKAIGSQVSALLAPLQAGKAGRQFVSADLLAAWPEIVGVRLAGLCMPVQMKPQPKSRSRHKKPGQDGAILEVRADPSVQIDLDYGQALLVERVNAFFGYQAVARLKVLPRLKMGSDQRARPSAQPGLVPTREGQARAHDKTARVTDPALRTALEALGACVLSAKLKP